MTQRPMTESPLKVLIAGGGISGLTAALGLRQQGHHVTVFERTELAKEFGAAIHIGPNCHGLLKKFGIFPETIGANRMEKLVEYDSDGNHEKTTDLRKPMEIWQDSWVLCHRVSLHDKLKEKATSVQGPGTPVTLLTASPAVDVDPYSATIVLANGSTYTGDLVLGADGVSSVTRKIVVGPDIKPFSSGKSMFRFMIPRDLIQNDPQLRHFVEDDGCMSSWVGDTCRLIMYPCLNNTIMNCAGIHPSSVSPAKGEGWDQDTSKDVLLDVFSKFGPLVKEMLSLVDSSTLKVWTLLDMNRIPRWYNGRLALLGDAAHPFLPYQGQGACVAVEDAASIAALLPRGTTRNDIPDRLALYQNIRDERAHNIQLATRMSGQDLSEEQKKEYNWVKSIAYNFGHDEWHNSTRVLKEYLWKRDANKGVLGPFGLSFGAVPLSTTKTERLRSLVYTVRFTTSATFLKTLFPTESFSFISRGTLVQASYEITEELAGSLRQKTGRKTVSLWVHGVRYSTTRGDTLLGSYLLVRFESPANDSASATQDILSRLPKLDSDIDIAKYPLETRIRCSQFGHEFLCITLQKISPPEETPAPEAADSARGFNEASSSQDETGAFFYKYVSGVNNTAEADASFAVHLPGDWKKASRVLSSAQGEGATVEIIAGNWKRLPTLHHVASTLADIPVYGILAVRVEERVGYDDFSKAEKVE